MPPLMAVRVPASSSSCGATSGWTITGNMTSWTQNIAAHLNYQSVFIVRLQVMMKN